MESDGKDASSMKKLLALVIAVTMALSGGMLTAAEETRVGQAQGFGGLVTVTLTLQGDTIVQCSVQGDRETQGVGSKAIEEMPDRIVQANGVGVDLSLIHISSPRDS